MTDHLSIEGPVERVGDQLMLRIPLEEGGDQLAPFAKGIGSVVDGCLEVVIQPWLAEMLRVTEGSLVWVDNQNGKFNVTRSASDDS